MKDPLGPRGVLPDYTNIKFPPFPDDVLWDIDTLSNNDSKNEWATMKDSVGMKQGYVGVPYEKVAGETAPVIRPHWPKVPEDAPERIQEIVEEMQAAESDRPWAEGYEEGIVKATPRRIKPKDEEGTYSDGEVLRRSRSRSIGPATTKSRGASVGPAQGQSSRSKEKATVAVKRSQAPGPRRTMITRAAAPRSKPKREFIGRPLTMVDRLRFAKAPSITDDDEGMIVFVRENPFH